MENKIIQIGLLLLIIGTILMPIAAESDFPNSPGIYNSDGSKKSYA